MMRFKGGAGTLSSVIPCARRFGFLMLGLLMLDSVIL